MTNKAIAIAFIALALGLAGGVVATYTWQRVGTPGSDRLFSRESANDEHEHGNRGEHDEHSEAQAEGVIKLSPAVLREFGIEVREASAGQITPQLVVPGEIVLNADLVAHIVPRVAGQVREVRGHLGDDVHAGDVLAVIDSRELAEAKSGDLAAEAKLSLMRTSLARVEKLFEKKIAPEEELLKARQEFAEAEIEHRTAEAKLHALGLTEGQVRQLHNEKDVDYSRYEIKAPFEGTVIEKHMSLGEVVGPESDVFVLADLSTVWVNLTIYQKDLASVRAGLVVTVFAGEGMVASGTIDYVSPVVEEATRTTKARVVLDNLGGDYRPGLFVTAKVQVDEKHVPVLVPKEALQTVDGQSIVFVQTDEGLELRSVVVGRSDDFNVEIIEGLTPGERFVSANAFTLKSELAKAGFEAGHAH